MKYIYLIVLLIVMLAACNPVATAVPTDTVTNTETPSTLPAPDMSTPTITPSAMPEIPTPPPGPTSTALPALRPGRSLTLASLHMIDEQTGWGIAVGGQIVHTLDGGDTWRDVTPHNDAYEDRGFFALDVNTAWATSEQQNCQIASCAPLPNNVLVWHTSDGGKTWQAGTVCVQGPECNFDFDVPSDYYHPIAIHFLDTQTGWLLVTVAHMMFQDRYRIYRTTDGGAHWSPLIDSFQGPMTNGVTGLAFQDQRTGWLSTSEIDGASDPVADWSVYQSTDAGLTWNAVSLPPPDPLPKNFAAQTPWCGATGVVRVPPSGVGVTIQCRVLSDPISYYDFYFHSSDDGKHWVSWQKTGDVDFIDPRLGWRSTLANGAYDLEQTRDGGQTWAKLKAVKWNGDLDFVNEQTGWALATSDNVVSLVHTTDGGKTWQEIKPVVTAP